MATVLLKRIEGQAERLAKARRLLEEGRVKLLTRDGSVWAVDSESDVERGYMVTTDGCSCPDYEYRHDEFEICKHMLAVELAKAQRGIASRN